MSSFLETIVTASNRRNSSASAVEVTENSAEFTEDEFIGTMNENFIIPVDHQSEEDFLSNLSPVDKEDFASIEGRPNEWKDRHISDKNEKCIFNIDISTADAWNTAKEEHASIKQTVRRIIGTNNTTDPTFGEIADIIFGAQSDFAASFCHEICLN